MESIETEVMEDPSKRDTRGRRIVKAEERERLIREYDVISRFKVYHFFADQSVPPGTVLMD